MRHFATTIMAYLFAVSLSSAQTGSCLKQKVMQAQKYADSPEVILSDSTSVTVAPTGSGTFTIYKAILVNNRAGALTNRIIKYDYDPLTAFAEFAYARVIKPCGEVIELDTKKTCDYAAPARAIYWGARQIMLEVGELSIGDVVEYQIDKKGFTYALLAESSDDDRFIPPMRGHFYDIIPFWCSSPTLRKVHRVSLAEDKDMQFQFYQGECSSSVRYEDGRKVYTFAKENMTPFKGEPNTRNPFDIAPKLMMSSTPRWEDKSVWFYNVNEDYDSFAAYAPAQKKVDELIKGKTGEMEKIAALTHWVADNIRYAGVTMGEGEGFTLHNTKTNYDDRAGVCKDIAATLISFLRMAGFDAYPAMTMAGSRVESIPADHFNHCVAVVKLSNGTLMPLDPTWVPFSRELWSSAEQQQNFLPGTPEGTDLQLSAISPAKDHYMNIVANNVIDDKGTLTGKFTIVAEGQSDLAIRRTFTTGWRTSWESTMEDQLLAVSPAAVLKSVDWGKDPKDYQAAPIQITFEYIIPDYAIVGENEIAFKAMTMNNLFNQIKSYVNINTSLEEREFGFSDRCSREVNLDETITIPNGYKVVNELKDSHDGSVASFEGTLTQSGNKISIKQTLSLGKRIYEVEDWNDFRTSVNMHKKFGEYIIIK